MNYLNNEKIIVAVQEEAIDITSLISKMKDESSGALSIFLGILYIIFL